MTERGLDQDGTIAREGALDRVPAAFVPVVEAARARITATFGDPRRPGARLHSAYLYGSIPRGTAVPAVSDLDLLIVLRDEPADADRAAASVLEAALNEACPQINGAGIVLGSVSSTLSELERYDGGFFVACLCTPLLGEDLAAQLPRYRPTSLLARETNGDLALVLPRWRARAADAATDADRRTLSRAIARRLVRTGFTLIMPRWAAGPATWTGQPACSPGIIPSAPGSCAAPPSSPGPPRPIPPPSPCSSMTWDPGSPPNTPPSTARRPRAPKT